MKRLLSIFLVLFVTLLSTFTYNKVEQNTKTIMEKTVAVSTIFEASKITTPRFVAIKNYTNKNGEVSNYLINLGTKVDNAKRKDVVILEELNLNDLFKPFELVIAKVAREEMLKSALKNIKPDLKDRTTQSQGQTNAYTDVAKNIRVHNETGNIFIFGKVVKKEVLIKGEYPTVNSSDKTLAKNRIRKILKTPKYRSFSLEELKTVKMNRKTLTLTVA